MAKKKETCKRCVVLREVTSIFKDRLFRMNVATEICGGGFVAMMWDGKEIRIADKETSTLKAKGGKHVK